MIRGRGLLGIALILCACSSDKKPDAGTNGDPDAAIADADDVDTGVPQKDGSIFVLHDGGGPIPCAITCDCPQGKACVDGECTSLGTPVWCCDKQGCPRGLQCLDQNNQPQVCDGDPDPPDAGPRMDAGPGQIGAFCEADGECDQAQGLVCWERFEEPFLWGHCTLEGCDFTPCPAGTECIQVGDFLTGCMLPCEADVDCRADAFCFPIPMAPFFGVCIPDCRDDFWDCSPRDGTVYCNPATGVFIPQCDFTPSHDNTALIGDACSNSTECATGDICLGQIAWGFQDGMCSHVCDGLPEATACPGGSTCQYLPPPNDLIGMCFRDCVGMTCPDRAGAACDFYDPNWFDPSCIPPIIP